MSDWPTVHTLHGPFTDQTSMLYRRIARRHWFVDPVRGPFDDGLLARSAS